MADADLYSKQKASEAELFERQKKAEAMAAYGDAAKQDMLLQALKVYFEQLPEIAKAIGVGYTNVDKIYMYGGETSQLAGNIMTNVTQVSEGLGESLGIDLKSLLSGLVGGKVATSTMKNVDYEEVKPKDPVTTTFATDNTDETETVSDLFE